MAFWPTDSHGNLEPDMEPFWHLGIVAASFVMLKESTENTLYNVAQVANVTQLVGRLIFSRFPDRQVQLSDIILF